jgi:catechol 2,3-dioxygenase-like lactoylglutathione lyase family enzyme
MIDHVSLAVRDLEASARFYEPVLAALGHGRLVERPDTIGFGKTYPEFWLNRRPAMAPLPVDNGVHICLRAPNGEAVDAFHAAALSAGGSSDGAPAVRPQYSNAYYAAFIRDPDGNRVEAVTFLRSAAQDGARSA